MPTKKINNGEFQGDQTADSIFESFNIVNQNNTLVDNLEVELENVRNEIPTATLPDANVTEGVVYEDALNPPSNNGVVKYNEVHSSKWFTPLAVSPDYSEREYRMLRGVKMFYSTSDDFRLSRFGKGHSTVGNTIRVARISTNETFILHVGNDTGRNVYQGVADGEAILLDVDWDLIPDRATFYVDTSTIRFKPTTVLYDGYEKYFASKYNDSNRPFFNNVSIVNDEIIYKSVNSNTVEIIQQNITLGKERVDIKFFVDDARDNGCLIGYRDDANSNRFLFGFEPAFNAIVIFNETVGFVRLVEGDLIPNGYISLSVELTGDEIVGYFNGQSFRFKNYGVTDDITLVNHRRMNIKVRNSQFHIKDYNCEEITPCLNVFEAKGTNVHVFRTGLAKGDSNYNDWAFVRTPENYDPKRSEPYPFVIGNHGNGWTMDGTIEKANYSRITQFGVDAQNNGAYLDTSAPYYKEFSNETIERLLEAGYVVCGTQNYSNAEYGSDEGRNALQEFFYYMKRNFNVEEKCFMIGASNGCMMSLNGAFLLGVQNIKAMVLQYPLCMLFRHYKAYAPHRPAIEAIYGLTGNETDAELHIAFNDHDPEYANAVNVGGVQYKSNLYPPIKVWHSPQDTITSNANNAIPFIDLIKRSNGKIEEVVATGQHGHFSHVDPVEILNFFNRYLR